MLIVRRACALAFIVGVTCWLASTVTDNHADVRTLVEVAPGHGFVVSDVPRLFVWAALVGAGLHVAR